MTLPRAVPHVILALATVVLGACSRAAQPDAYGNVEVQDVVVGAQASGELLRFTAHEGERVAAGAVIGVVDTTESALQYRQAAAERAASESRTIAAARQVDALRAQYGVAQRALERTRRLFVQQAATAQQMDQAEREYRTLSAQVRAMEEQRRGAAQEEVAARLRGAQIRERIDRSRVVNPHAGTVLTTYARAGEVVRVGQPLYRIASLDTVDVRAYVAEPQLAAVRLGSHAIVSVDTGATRRRLRGLVTWISSQAEFTPTPIQTRDERASLVYAVKISVANPGGILKIGMPADVRFTTTAAPRPSR